MTRDVSLLRLLRRPRWRFRWWYVHIFINRLARRYAPYGYTGKPHDAANHWLWNLNTWAHEQDMAAMPSAMDRHRWHR